MSDLAGHFKTVTAEQRRIADDLVANMTALALHLDVYLAPQYNGWSRTLRTIAAGVKVLDSAVIVDFAARNRSSSGLTDIGLFRSALRQPLKDDDQSEAIAELDRLVGNILADGRQLENFVFNISDAEGGSLCPCCGYADAFHGLSFGAHGGIIGTGICNCCLFEPGFDDDPKASGTQFAPPTFAIAAYHGTWRSDGMPWRGKVDGKPLGWSAVQQLEHLRKTAPYLPGIIETDAWDVVRAREKVEPPKQP